MAEIDVRRLTAAARALMLAGRWAQAAGLLEDASAASPAERAVLAVAQAEVAVDQDFWVRTNLGSSALERASTAAADAAADPSVGFDLEFLRLKHDYTGKLFGAAGDAPRFGPQGRNAEVIDRLASRAANLRASAPDRERAAAATFYAGQARQMWERSAEQRQRAGAVPYVLSQQLLLAGLARDTGDPDAARTVAREVGRWAHALGVTLLESQAAEIAGS